MALILLTLTAALIKNASIVHVMISLVPSCNRRNASGGKSSSKSKVFSSSYVDSLLDNPGSCSMCKTRVGNSVSRVWRRHSYINQSESCFPPRLISFRFLQSRYTHRGFQVQHSYNSSMYENTSIPRSTFRQQSAINSLMRCCYLGFRHAWVG
jgi:hypothetical protein